jgi:TRAP-type C4-dicarboxylate transport system substrate-binding protein
MDRRTYLLRSGAACLATLAGFRPARAADYTLRLGSITVESSPNYRQVQQLARGMEQASAGVLEIADKPAGGYGRPAALYDMVESGDLDMAYTVQGYSPGRFPQTSVMELPLLFNNAVEGTSALRSLYEQGMLSRDYNSVKVLALTALSPYGLFTSGKTMTHLRELRGLRVRAASLTLGLMLSRLGMIPLGVPLDLMSEMLADHTLDAVTYGWDSMGATQGTGPNALAEQVKVLIDAQFPAPTLMLIMNRQKWGMLSPELQAVLEQQGQVFATTAAEGLVRRDAEARARFKADPRYSYVELTDATRGEMTQALQPMITAWKESMTKQGYDGETLYDAAVAAAQASKPAAG